MRLKIIAQAQAVTYCNENNNKNQCIRKTESKGYDKSVVANKVLHVTASKTRDLKQKKIK